MTTTDIAVRETPAALPAKVRYAHELAASGLLPAAYRRNPANVLYAIEYGEMLGLSTMAALTGVHVIDGKPSASAGLISALVRRAGHKLRIRGDAKSATCQIVRSDDPGYTFEVTFTIDDAKAAGLTGKDVWKKYAASMLKARAITQCARDACEEALFGLHYTPEELGADVDYDGTVIGEDTDEDTDPGPDVDPPWTDQALEQAASFKTEAEAQALWRESAAAVLDGRCTPNEATHIQNLINARIADRRKDAATRILRKLDGDDPWRLKVEELASLADAQDALRELAAVAPDQVDMDRANLISRAIVALFPKAAVKTGDGDG